MAQVQIIISSGCVCEWYVQCRITYTQTSNAYESVCVCVFSVTTHWPSTCSATGAQQNHRRTDGGRTDGRPATLRTAICVSQRSVGRSVCPSYTRVRNSQSNLIDNRFLFQSITERAKSASVYADRSLFSICVPVFNGAQPR